MKQSELFPTLSETFQIFVFYTAQMISWAVVLLFHVLSFNHPYFLLVSVEKVWTASSSLLVRRISELERKPIEQVQSFFQRPSSGSENIREIERKQPPVENKFTEKMRRDESLMKRYIDYNSVGYQPTMPEGIYRYVW